MRLLFGNQFSSSCVLILLFSALGKGQDVIPFEELFSNWRQLNEILVPKPTNNHGSISNPPSKVVFPIPEDVIENRSYLPNLGLLTDLAFLILPRDFAAAGVVRLSRDLIESEQCFQYVGCEMTEVTQRYKPLNWISDFLQDFPFQGDFVDRLKQGSTDALSRLNEKKKIDMNRKEDDHSRNNQKEICTFSCHPIKSLRGGLKILSLLHELVRTVK